MEHETFTGSCLCGAVRFELNAPPSELLRCHCRMCQKAHGAEFATFARFAHDDWRIIAGEDDIAEYRSSSAARRTFCRQCGSALQFIRDGKETFGLALSALDTPLPSMPLHDYHAGSACEPYSGELWFPGVTGAGVR